MRTKKKEKKTNGGKFLDSHKHNFNGLDTLYILPVNLKQQ